MHTPPSDPRPHLNHAQPALLANPRLVPPRQPCPPAKSPSHIFKVTSVSQATPYPVLPAKPLRLVGSSNPRPFSRGLSPGRAPRAGTSDALLAQHGCARVPPGAAAAGASEEPGVKRHLERLAHLRRVRQEPRGTSPSGQGGQAGELRGGARPALHRPPQGLAVVAHR